MKHKLNKEICQECYRRKRGWKWRWDDEERWENNKILCPGQWSQFKNGSRFLSYILGLDNIPDYCGYRLEQEVLGNRDEN